MSRKRLAVLGLLFAAPQVLSAQTTHVANRIAARIDSTAPVALPGHVHARAQARFDRGAVDGSLPLADLALLLKPSSAQQSDLEQLLREQQDPGSLNYHRWLTPEEFADRFGVSPADLTRVEEWLSGQGFQITYRSRARNWIGFSGTAAQVEQTFRTSLHRYVVEGREHYGNATAPSIPAALAGVVGAVRGMHNFRLKPMLRSTLSPAGLQPQFTDPQGRHYLAPDDLATIYDLWPLYNSGFNGAGQKLAVVGQTDIIASDIAAFQSIFNLPGNAPQQVLFGRDPGVSPGDVPEAELDLEWSSAIARNATILYVYSTDVLTSAQYAVDQNLAPVISMSYGGCESDDQSIWDSYRATAQQGAIQGISWVAASGDSGAAGCDSASASRASQGLAVEFPASIPEVTAVGGTEFNESGGTFWNSTDGTNQGSALTYIPEIAWNDTSTDHVLSATGGGSSVHFPVPSWQSGAGFPNDGHRDVPDVAMAASPDHDGFIVCAGTTNCPAGTWKSMGVGSGFAVYGGTSASAPIFAGILALLNQYMTGKGIQAVPGLGSANPTLYWIARNSPSAFHDITIGNNVVPCQTGTNNCSTGSLGYSAGGGYDQTTGLGSVDAYSLVSAWATAAVPQITSISPATPSVNPNSQTISVSGNGFQPGLTVSLTSPSNVTASFLPANVTAGNFQVTLALNALGTWKLAVTDPDGRQSNTFSFVVGSQQLGPAAVASAAANVSVSSATLVGTVNPNGAETLVWFLYGTSASLLTSSSTPQQDVGSGTYSIGVSANVAGLASNTTYYFQLWASNSTGTSKSAVFSFTTAGFTMPSVPSGLTPVNGLTGVSSTPVLAWNASANATGYTVYFGITNPPPVAAILSGANSTSYSPGLFSGFSTYYWQVVATNSVGSAASAIMTFTTGALVLPGTKAGAFRRGNAFLLDSNGDGIYETSDRYIATFIPPGGNQPGDLPVAGDWTGDGHAKVGIFRPSTGQWFLDANNDSIYDYGDYTYSFGGLPGDLPMTGDWNAVQGVSTHKDCIGVYRNGSVWLLDLNCNGTYDGMPTDAFFPFGGVAGDVPVVGKWTGGTTRVGVVRAYAPYGVPLGPPFLWVFDNADANAGSSALTHQPAPGAFAFGGLAGDVFITGDWNNTGTAKAGIFRSGAAGAQPFEWVLDANGSHGPDVVFNLYGVQGDVAIPGKW